MLLLQNGERHARARLPGMQSRYGRSCGAGRRASGLVAETGPLACGACRGEGTAQVPAAEADERLNHCARLLRALTDWLPKWNALSAPRRSRRKLWFAGIAAG